MNFHISIPNFLKTLPVMLNGMLGGMVVMALICLLMLGLQRIGRRGKKGRQDA